MNDVSTYDEQTVRSMVPDPAEQFHNPYLAMGNNPVMYVDPDGEFVWLVPVLAGVVFGGVNLGIQASNGEIDNFVDGLEAFGSGFIAGAAIATGVVAGLSVPVLGTAIKVAGAAYLGTAYVGVAVGMVDGVATGDWTKLENTYKQLAGNFYLDGNRDFLGQTWQGISRFSWELPQSTIGHGISQVRNVFGGVDRVDYFGGATFSTAQNQERTWGFSVGNNINISIEDEIEGNFEERVLRDPLYMHEYGHSFSSQAVGLGYLPIIALPSLISAATSTSKQHSRRWYERQANSYAGWYFKRFGVNWDIYKEDYPRKMDE